MKYSNDELSKQLRCPAGTDAREIGENMFQSNCNMICETINTLIIKPNSKVLEIGFGNGMHLPYLFEKETTLKYEGIEISQAMVDEANLNNDQLVKSGQAVFKHTTENELVSLSKSAFDCCFTVNTIYFWNNPQQYLNEIYRILANGASISLGFISKHFGEKLPFTQTGFVFYETEEIETFLSKSGFRNIRSLSLTEDAISKNGLSVKRPFVIVSANK